MRHLFVTICCGVPFFLFGCSGAQISTNGATGLGTSSTATKTASLVGDVWCVGDAWGGSDTLSSEDVERISKWQEQLSALNAVSDMEAACGVPIRGCLDIASYKTESSAWPAGGMGEDGGGCEDGFEAVVRACRASGEVKARIASKVSQVACQRFHTPDPRNDSQADLDRDLGQFYDDSTQTLITRSWIKQRESAYSEVATEKYVDDYTLSLWIAENL